MRDARVSAWWSPVALEVTTVARKFSGLQLPPRFRGCVALMAANGRLPTPGGAR